MFLLNNVPQAKKKSKKSKFVLGVADAKLGAAIQETLDIPCTSGETFLLYMTSPVVLNVIKFLFSLHFRGHCDRDVTWYPSLLPQTGVRPDSASSCSGTAWPGAQLLSLQGQVQRPSLGQHDHPVHQFVRSAGQGH